MWLSDGKHRSSGCNMKDIVALASLVFLCFGKIALATTSISKDPVLSLLFSE